METPADKSAPSLSRPRRNWLRFSLRSLLILVTLSGLAVGGKLQFDRHWKRRLVAEWVAPLAKQAHLPVGGRSRGDWPQLPPKPPGVQPEREIELLTTGVLDLDTSEERFSALRILVEMRGRQALPVLREFAGKCRHADLQATLLHLISLDRDPKDIPRIEAFLDSKSPEVRAAAAESLAYIHEPSYGFAHGFQWWGQHVHLNTVPSIDASVLADRGWSPFEDITEDVARDAKRQSKTPQRIRDRIEALMLHGATTEERTAAARALVAWPPSRFSLRLAEWGVWIDDQEQVKLSEDVLAEIPPFVHGAGNSLASLPRNRYHGIIVITKPIIHLTADRPLAVDLEVAIASGRPWFVYPRPDGFTVELDHQSSDSLPLGESVLDDLRPSQLRWLEPLSEGYPWVHPIDRSEGKSTAAYARRAGITAVGVRWQSLIVSPQSAPWITPPDVPPAPRFKWWSALRDVPSSWIASRGEAERFLYYDGPSLARSPHVVSLNETKLTLMVQAMFRPRPDVGLPPNTTSIPRKCLLIDANDKQPRALAFAVSSIPGTQKTVDLANATWLSGNEAERRLLTILLDCGLTEPEAQGLFASWRIRFFQTPGRRLLTILSQDDYGRICPLHIRPSPTHIVRVGIILLEL